LPGDRPAADEHLHRADEEHDDRGRVLGPRGRRAPAVPLGAQPEPDLCPALDHALLPSPDRPAHRAAAGARATLEGGPMTTAALYDQPGPRAIARNQIFGVVSGVAVLALLAWI